MPHPVDQSWGPVVGDQLSNGLADRLPLILPGSCRVVSDPCAGAGDGNWMGRHGVEAFGTPYGIDEAFADESRGEGQILRTSGQQFGDDTVVGFEAEPSPGGGVG